MAAVVNGNLSIKINRSETPDNTGYLNTLRVFATFAVIMIHVFSPIISYFSNSLTKTETYICVILRNLWQWCVPIFVMITGVLFLNPEKEITLGKIIKRYFLRIVLAIVIFGMPFCFMEIIFDANMIFNISQIGIAVLNAIQGKSWDHMWYLYMIAGLYLCVPLIKVFVIHAPKDIVKYTLTILFIFTSVIPSLELIIPYKFGIYIPINSVYLFYLLLGYYIHYNKIKINIGISSALLAVYLLFAIIMPLNKNFVVLSNGGHIILTGYNSPVVVMAAFAVFCILYQINRSGKIIEKIAPMCFGIYLIHTLPINILYKFINFSPKKYPLIIVVIMTTLITIILSIFLVIAARKIKIIRKYVL